MFIFYHTTYHTFFVDKNEKINRYFPDKVFTALLNLSVEIQRDFGFLS